MVIHRCSRIWFSGLFAASFLAYPSQAQIVSGEATAADGDSLVVGGKRVRLFGIDAPELAQSCTKQGIAWNCGEQARDNLAELVKGQTVYCQGQGVDQHARLVAVCSAGNVELNEAMVAYGWAIAYREFSDAYVPAEIRAKANGFGIWSSQFQNPAEYRLSLLPAPPVAAARAASPPPRRGATTSPLACVIKGNRNRRGQWIYHLPGMPYYEQTRAEEMFCTEAEAQAAGYRRAIVRN
ncbi:MAG: thermonuclease family protein [Proteobacteria bacterium]|jgi:endonuclease YncB( thermonuclease family)|nr:thermonuclease family protein [Pseudomonadota bacterium]